MELVYCLIRKIFKCNSLVQKICVSLKRDIILQSSFALGPQGPKHNICGDHFYLKNAGKLRFLVFLLFHARKHMISSFFLKWTNSQDIVNFVPIVCPQGPELNWQKFTISCKFGPL